MINNITAAWAVDREFVYIVLWRPLGRLWALWLALGCPWAPFGHPLGSLWLSWATFSLPLGVLGLPLAPFWPPLWRPWDPLGCLGAPVGSPGATLGSLARFGKLNVHRLRCLCIKSSLLEHATGATGAAGTAGVVSRTAARSPPPTRAGRQDDTSYTNSLKICRPPKAVD